MDFAEACIAHLRKDHLEGNGYSVRGLVGQGDELTRYIDAQGLTRHHDYPHRQGYLMVRFDHGGYVMLELGAEGLPSHAVRTRDQRGRPWMVRQGSCGRQPRAPGDDRARGND
ncbi:MAG: hypothetical protein K6A65_01110 [Succinivibrionaceae bacterium]|nr:hypothetical protein [Succinivibrionaceae bacterium]